GGHPMFEFYANHLAPGAAGAIPRAMKGGEDFTAVSLWEGGLATDRRWIKSHLQRRGMRLQRDIGDDGLTGEVGAFARMTRILMVAEVVPRPAIVSTFLDRR